MPSYTTNGHSSERVDSGLRWCGHSQRLRRRFIGTAFWRHDNGQACVGRNGGVIAVGDPGVTAKHLYTDRLVPPFRGFPMRTQIRAFARFGARNLTGVSQPRRTANSRATY
jgi:hypothetical protein